MYVIVMILMQYGAFKITSDQIVYPTLEQCEISRTVLVDILLQSKPSDQAAVFSKCTELTIEHVGKPSQKL